MCPAWASSRADMAPKPLDAPVITTVFRSVVVSSDMLVSFKKCRLYGGMSGGTGPARRAGPSDHSAVRVDGLAVDPTARAGQERHDLGDVLGLAQAVHRV